MELNKLLEQAEVAADIAKKAGANDAGVMVSRSREVQVEWRDGKLDRIRESTTRSLSLSVYVEGRYSANSTSDLRADALDEWIRGTVASTRYLAKDPHRKLPSPDRYKDPFTGDLDVHDPRVASISPEDRLTAAREMEEGARAAKGSDKLISLTSTHSDTESLTVGVTTNGFQGTRKSSAFSRYAEASVQGEGDRKPSQYAWAEARQLEDMPACEAIGREALERSLAQIGSKQVPTGKYDLIVENRIAGGILRYLLQGLQGSMIQQERSFLADKLGKQVGSKALHITDNPHLVRGLGSRSWDSEGMSTRPRPVFEDGVLRTWYLDTYYSSKLGLEPTTSGPSNLVWRNGDKDLAGLLAQVKQGILVNSFLGGNANTATGDFSAGVIGFYIENGQLKHPVSEVNVAGNLLDIWGRLAEVGNDPTPWSSYLTPSLLFREIQCSGS